MESPGNLPQTIIATYHPALNSLGKVARRLHPMLTNLEEHTGCPRKKVTDLIMASAKDLA